MQTTLGLITDVLLLSFLFYQTWMGWRSGLLWQITHLLALAFGLLLGFCLTPLLSPYLVGRLTANSFHAHLIVFIFLVGLAVLVLRLIAVWIEHSREQGVAQKEREKRRAKNRILGGVFGALKGGVTLAVLMAVVLQLWPGEPMYKTSKLVSPFAAAGDKLIPFSAWEDVKDWFGSTAQDLTAGLKMKIRPSALEHAKERGKGQ